MSDYPTLTLYTWPKTETPATELAKFYFPGCSVTRKVDKDIRTISMSGITKIIDLLRTDDSFRIVGTWLDDHQNLQFDGLRTINRQHLIYELCTITELYGKIDWDDNTYDETLYVLPHDLNCDSDTGNTGMFTVNFLFAVLIKEPKA